jgi:hypothetical protein
MKLVVTAIMESGSGLSNILVIILMLWLMFGIFGVSLMKNRLRYCNLPASYPYQEPYYIDKVNCLKITGATWIN